MEDVSFSVLDYQYLRSGIASLWLANQVQSIEEFLILISCSKVDFSIFIVLIRKLFSQSVLDLVSHFNIIISWLEEADNVEVLTLSLNVYEHVFSCRVLESFCWRRVLSQDGECEKSQE
ncbi:unnamed protein product [Moneuplotes crassus]|uniref:Uncharacterized protein n=1 Tax=Euplotes crassus TaxID=5936 RepID=A0AAD1XW35_EUPCR|nr:unnamed protein product [Moneuplotes crassus]